MKAVTLFGKMLTFSRLKINTQNLDELKSELQSMLPNTINTVPVVIDSAVTLDLEKLVDLLWSLGLHPIGVVDGELNEQAQKLRLATFPADGKRIERIKATTSPKPPAPTPKEATKEEQAPPLQAAATSTQTVDKNTLQLKSNITADEQEERGVTSSVHNQMLRSGQSLQHLGGDLVIVGGVNDGAEAITDNSLHIYGRGLGRLVAGATGDKDARIFCQKFNPSLVSVAGTYCLREAIPAEMVDKAVQVSYDEEKGLIFTLMAG